MPSWDPVQYLRFADHRMRPALDLIGRIPDIEAAEIWDLGCGTGAITSLLADRWSAASVHGLDSSPEMLQQAGSNGAIDWVEGDIARWQPPGAVDLIFANASLHWLEHHEVLFPRLMRLLRPEGILAVQMPHNHGEASHQVLYRTARSAPWAGRVGHLVADIPVAEPGWYHSLLTPLSEILDVWETTYQHVLDGDDAVAEWTRGSVLKPYLDELGSEAADFFAEYAAALLPEYPQQPDGTTLFPFRRIFIVAQARNHR